MTASIETWRAYGRLLARLYPNLHHAMLAGADGRVLWTGDAQAAALLQPTLAILASSGSNRQRNIDGLLDLDAAPVARYGFRVRGELGEVLGFVLLTATPESAPHAALAQVHASIRPALDCLQMEFTACVARGELRPILADDSRNLGLYEQLSAGAGTKGEMELGEIARLALERLPGSFAAMLIPDYDLTLCRAPPDRPPGIEAAVLAQLHRHLLTRARLHGCTLVINLLSLEEPKAPLPYKALSSPLRDELGRVVGVLAVFRAQTGADFQFQDAEVLELLARKADQITRADFDSATGLLTAAAFAAQTASLLTAAGSAPACGLLYIDIDQLNVVNENHGRVAGDEVIQGVASLLARRRQGKALAARLGGDRFAMLVPGCGIEPAARIAEELRAAALKLSGQRAQQSLQVSLSIGVARIAAGEALPVGALAEAEDACRAAKERGRNRVEVCEGSAEARARHAADFPGAAATALATGSLELLAQPILPLGAAPSDPRFEILLRMRNPDGSRLGPGQRAAAAGAPELARRIDRWIVEQSVSRLQACREVLRRHPARFSLSLSGASLADAQFWDSLQCLLRGSGLEPGTLSFDVPEAAVSGHLGRTAARMSQLRALGATFTLSDFGRRPASLAALDALPVSSVKLRGSLSRHLPVDPRSRSTVLAIATLAQAAGLETIATQIETDAIRARAVQLGVDYGQGHFIGKPLALDDALADLPLYACFATSTGLFDAPPSAAFTAARAANH